MKVGIGLFLPLFRQNFYTFPFFSTGDRPLMSMIKPLKMAQCKSILNTKELTTRWRVQTTHGRASLLPLVVSPQLRSKPVDPPHIVTRHLTDQKAVLGCFGRILIQKSRSPVKTGTCSVKVLYMQQWGIRNGSHLVAGLTLFQIQKYVWKFRMLCLRWFTTPCFGSET